MTSTEYNIGLTNSKKSSSRVLKPPGGGHSNIFEPVDKGVNNPRPKYDQQNSSNINFCVNSPDPNQLVEQLKHEVVKTSEVQITSATTSSTTTATTNNHHNNKTDDVKAATTGNSRAEVTRSNGSSSNNKNNNNNEGGIQIGAPQPQQPPKTGRVPPGGFSSGLW